MMLDLGGIAKGYAVDAAMRVLKQHGVTRALIAGGENIGDGRAAGIKAGFFRRSSRRRSAARLYLCLRDRAVSTSGRCSSVC